MFCKALGEGFIGINQVPFGHMKSQEIRCGGKTKGYVG
jgi:hypothetical protein